MWLKKDYFFREFPTYVKIVATKAFIKQKIRVKNVRRWVRRAKSPSEVRLNFCRTRTKLGLQFLCPSLSKSKVRRADFGRTVRSWKVYAQSFVLAVSRQMFESHNQKIHFINLTFKIKAGIFTNMLKALFQQFPAIFLNLTTRNDIVTAWSSK